jgi:polar amino acid transport system substrate-binding protein
VTTERQKNYDFTTPYLKGQYSLLVKNDADIKTFDSFKDGILGLQAGSPYEARNEKELKNKYPGLTSQVMSKIPDLLQSLRADRVSAILLGRSEASCIMKGSEGISKVDIDFDTPGEEDPGIALPKGSLLREDMNKVLLEMEKDGTISVLKTKWKIQA